MANSADYGDADALSEFPTEDESSASATVNAPVIVLVDVQRTRTSDAVPPSARTDIDALLEALAKPGRSPMLEFRSELEEGEALASAPVQESSLLLLWRPVIVRWVLLSAAAFLVGAVSVVWGLHPPPPLRNTDASVIASRQNSMSSVSAPTAAPVASPPAAPSVGPAPVSEPRRETVLARAAAPPAAAKSDGPPLTPRPIRPALVASAPHPRGPQSAAQSTADRRMESPTLTPLAKFPARSDSLTAIAAPIVEVPQPPVTAALPAAAPAITPAVAGADAAAEEHAIWRALHSYEEASEDLDVAATANVWPTVDRGALARAFATLKSQGLDFRTCSIAVNDARAVAHCRGTVQFVRKVGSPAPLTSEQVWIFEMRRSGGDWKIDQVSASPAPVAVAHGREQE